MVATREGGVDRNCTVQHRSGRAAYVATREGGVDRNTFSWMIINSKGCRHPRGWRG